MFAPLCIISSLFFTVCSFPHYVSLAKMVALTVFLAPKPFFSGMNRHFLPGARGFHARPVTFHSSACHCRSLRRSIDCNNGHQTQEPPRNAPQTIGPW